MAEVHEKEVNLKHTTVKIPGQRPPKALSSATQSQPTTDSRPTTPVENVLMENNNTGTTSDSIGKNATVIQNGLALECSQVDGIDLEASNNQFSIPAASNQLSSSNKGEQNASNVVKKKNKRSKHTKSCEIDYEELEKVLACAATAATGQPIMRNESHNSSLKKKGHRRAKSGSGKFDTDTGNTGNSQNIFRMMLIMYL